MVREYLKQNVYDALLERLDFIFRVFDNIYISFFRRERQRASAESAAGFSG